jgi:hypothetical protein
MPGEGASTQATPEAESGKENAKLRENFTALHHEQFDKFRDLLEGLKDVCKQNPDEKLQKRQLAYIARIEGKIQQVMDEKLGMRVNRIQEKIDYLEGRIAHLEESYIEVSRKKDQGEAQPSKGDQLVQRPSILEPFLKISEKQPDNLSPRDHPVSSFERAEHEGEIDDVVSSPQTVRRARIDRAVATSTEINDEITQAAEAENDRAPEIASLLQNTLAASVLPKKQSEAMFIRNSISVQRQENGQYKVVIHNNMLKGRINTHAVQVLASRDLFPTVKQSAGQSFSNPMNLEGLEAFAQDFETRLVSMQEKPAMLGGDFVPPPDAKSYKPGMSEDGAKIEDLAKANRHFTITPPLPEDFKTGVYDVFQNGEWSQQESVLHAYEFSNSSALDDIHTIAGKARGSIAIALPLRFRLQKGSLRVTPAVGTTISEDQYGVAHIKFNTNNVVTYSMKFGLDPSYQLENKPTSSEETNLVNLQNLKPDTQTMMTGLPENGSNLEIARDILQHIKSNFYYSRSKAASNHYLANDGKYYLERVDAGISQGDSNPRLADCDVAATYFVALCRKAGVPARLAVGYASSREGNRSILGSINKHGWAEVWNEAEEEWVKFDATPTRQWHSPEDIANQQAPEQDPSLRKGDVDLWSQEYKDLIHEFEQMAPHEGIVGNFTSLGNPQFKRGELSMWYHNSSARTKNTSDGKFYTFVKIDYYRPNTNNMLVFNRSEYASSNVYHTAENLKNTVSLKYRKQSAQEKARDNGYKGVEFRI